MNKLKNAHSAQGRPFSYVVVQNWGYVMVVSLGGCLSCQYATAELLYRVNEGLNPRLKLPSKHLS